MSDAKQCDECGDFYNEPIDYQTFTDDHLKIEVKTIDTRKNGKFDLCPKCLLEVLMRVSELKAPGKGGFEPPMYHPQGYVTAPGSADS